jgi:AraC-like DNA-binding protein
MKKFPKKRISNLPVFQGEKTSDYLIERLRSSELFQSYREIFLNSTGLPLDLKSVRNQQSEDDSVNAGGSRLCQILNSLGRLCKPCAEAHNSIRSNETKGVRSIRCFAGLCETVVPVIHGQQVLAQLMTGHISHEKPSRDGFLKLKEILGTDKNKEVELERSYFEIAVIRLEQYQAMTTLLAAFALQLGDLAGQIVLELRHEKSDCIASAKDYIEEMIYEPIYLDEVASEVHMSRYYLCRRFKQATGRTLTEYVTDRRVKIAESMLEKTSMRVADIAFEVGFQSLSQFNRCFHRINGFTPTQYRRSVRIIV